MSDTDAPATGDEDVVNPADAQMGWADAMSELSTILAELERDDVDLDVLADRVERAALVDRSVSGPNRRTRLRVDELVSELAQDDLTE